MVDKVTTGCNPKHCMEMNPNLVEVVRSGYERRKEMKILKMLGYYTEEEINKYKHAYELQKQVSLDLIHELNEQQKVLDAVLRENTMLKSDPEQYIEMKIAERELEVCNNPMRHKAYALGCRDTFARYGGILFDARIKGDKVVIDADGKPIECFTAADLEDVQEDTPEWQNEEVPEEWQKLLDDSIIIDDLAEIGA